MIYSDLSVKASNKHLQLALELCAQKITTHVAHSCWPGVGIPWARLQYPGPAHSRADKFGRPYFRPKKEDIFIISVGVLSLASLIKFHIAAVSASIRFQKGHTLIRNI